MNGAKDGEGLASRMRKLPDSWRGVRSGNSYSLAIRTFSREPTASVSAFRMIRPENIMRPTPRALLIALCCTWSAVASAAIKPLELVDGDRVVFLGGTLIEREQKYGYWEMMLTCRHPDRNVTFRNLGWSGDTVWGEARAGFGTVADGFRELKEHVEALKPTVIFVAYGANESFAGPEGLPRFIEGYGTLLDVLAKTGARIVLLSPTPHEDLGRPLPNPTEQNKNLALYRDAIREIAAKRGARFVDLFELLGAGRNAKTSEPLTDNGIHLTADGYRRTAAALAKGLGWNAAAAEIETASAPAAGPRSDPSDDLRRAIVRKNELYFYRWRPQNVTYLFGFRKHEQGNNAKEVVQFDPLVAALEAKIAKLRVLVAHTPN
jgi:lysophospholipase L1-like esterase